MSTRPNISPLERANKRLVEGLARYRDDTTDDQIRDGLIQRFEFTYELSVKVLKRYSEYASADPSQFDTMTFQDQIRTGNEHGVLLGEWRDWRGYRDMRARTSHTYDESTASEVVDRIPQFINEVDFLLVNMNNRLK